MAKKKATKKGVDPKPVSTLEQKLEDPPKRTNNKNKPRDRRQQTRNENKSQSSMAPPAGSSQSVQRYDSKAARQRQDKQHFHPDVSDKKVLDVILEFDRKWRMDKNRPSRDEYLAGKNTGFFTGLYMSSSMLLKARQQIEYDPKDLPCRLLEVFAGLHPYGKLTGEMLGMKGIKTLESLALAIPQSWAAVSQGMAIWDFTAQKFDQIPFGPVFLSLTPERSQQSFDSSKATNLAKVMEKDARRIVINFITNMHDRCGTTAPYWGRHENVRDGSLVHSPQVAMEIAKYGTRLVYMIRSLPHIEGLEEMIERVVDPAPHQAYHMSKQVALNSTFKLLHNIFNRKHMLRVLHLHKTPLLDRRLLAIILRSCPLIKMVGVYDCPLFHVGDVICLLDMIHEVNVERRREQRPIVEALDFYPRYHSGMPHRGNGHQDSQTYGLTWKPRNNEIVQRGLLAIVMQAVLKSRRMKIDLLMDKDAAFMAYLSNLPMLPLKVFSFLDGLYRYLDLMKAKSKNENAKKQATYDMLKAVRLDVEYMESDWPRYYREKMATGRLFCCSCGYELLPEFFSNGAVANAPHARFCAACGLREWLDKESDHQKRQSMDILTPFFPGWDPKGFNMEAAVLQEGREFFRLGTRKAHRDPIPPMRLLDNGEFYRPEYKMELVRDRKIHDDCVQGLPDLETLLRKANTDNQVAKDEAVAADASRIVALLLKDFYPTRTGDLDAFATQRPDGGAPDHHDESQGCGRDQAQHAAAAAAVGKAYSMILSHNFESASARFGELDEEGH
ncbi:hypothetical protein F66182_147 [Fusarium sp. NRRL 66182]|nr:hypothetical protein F66182_147 [Fusarium sp. NRRL 66182]